MKPKSQEELNAQYQKNIFFLQERFPDIATSVLDYEFKVYEVAFHIEDKETKEGFFNLRNIQDKALYHSQNPHLEAQNIIKNIQEPKDFFTTNVINSIDNSMSIRIQEYVQAEEYIDNYKSDNIKNPPAKIVCFGTATGALIDAIVELPDTKAIYIFEPDIEIFKYSLFFTDYTKLVNNRQLFLAVGSDEENIHKTFNIFQQSFVSYNYSTKFVFVNPNLRTYINTIVTEYLRTNLFELSFEHYLSTHINSYYNLLNFPVIDFNRTKADISKKVLLVMSGPSLQKNIEFIKKAKDKFFIVAVGSSLYPLFKNGIDVDVCFTMDGKRRKKEEFINIDKSYIKKTLFIASEIVDPGTSDFISPIICFGKNKRTVGHYALGILSEWGFKNIYTIGNDVCLEDNREYIQGLSFKERLINSDDSHDDGYSYEKIMEIKGNFRPIVKSKMKFLSYISTYEVMKTTYLFDKDVYNLSDGAYIEGMIPLHSEDIDLSSMDIIDKPKVIDFKMQLPSEQEAFAFNIDINIQKIKKLISMSKEVNINRDFYSLIEYINYRDATFMNEFSIKVKPLYDAGGIIRYILFFDNLIFSFLDNANFSNEELNSHIKYLANLFQKGLVNVLETVLSGLLQAKELREKIQNEQKPINTYIFLKDNIDDYFITKYQISKHSSKKVNIQSIFDYQNDLNSKKIIFNKNKPSNTYSIAIDSNTVYSQDVYHLINNATKDFNATKDDSLLVFKHCKNVLENKKLDINILDIELKKPDTSFPSLVENILYGASMLQDIPIIQGDVVLIITYRNNFLQYYKDILTQLEQSSIKRIHFHILNTYHCKEDLSNNLFTGFNLEVSITIQNKFVFFTHLFHYLSAITYEFIDTLLQKGAKNIILLDIQSLILQDFSSILKHKKDFAFYQNTNTKKINKEVLFIRNSDTSKSIIKALSKNAKLNIYIDSNENEIFNDINLISKIFKDDISTLPQKYCDESLKNNSFIWVKPINTNNSRFENKKISITHNSQLTTRHSKKLADLSNSNISILNRKTSGMLTVADIQDYNGFLEYKLKYNQENMTFSMFMSLGDDTWLKIFLRNEYHNQTTLAIWSILCKNANGFVVDKNSYNGIFSIISHHYFIDTITLEESPYQYARIILNLKTNNLPSDYVYLDDIEHIDKWLTDKIKTSYKDKISILKGTFNDYFFKDIISLHKLEKQNFDILLSIEEDFSNPQIQKFKQLGYSIYHIDEYNHKISNNYTNNKFAWLSKTPLQTILEQFSDKDLK